MIKTKTILTITTLIMLSMLTLMSAGCGQKGPLYIPDETQKDTEQPQSAEEKEIYEKYKRTW